MSQAESPAADSSPRPPKRRYWFLIVIDAVAILAILAVWLLLPDRFDRGARMVFTFFIVVAATVSALAWFFLLGRLPARVRWTGAALLAGLILLVPATVRRVEFSGDMVPTFFFRWSPDRYEVLEAHRARQRATLKASDQAGPDEVAIAVDADAPPVSATEYALFDYRGPRRDGIVDDPPPLARSWSGNPPKLVWRQPVGGGYASFVVAGQEVLTIEQRRENEAIVAYDFDTGRELWVYDYPALFSEAAGGDGPRATPTIADGKLYAMGATGVLTCLDLDSHERVWSVNILEQNGSANLDWAMAGSPLIDGGVVVVCPGNQKGTAKSRAITAFDAQDGKPLWGGGEAKAGYASLMFATLAGQRQILSFEGQGLAAYDPHDGRELWRTPWTSDFDINAAQPVLLDGDRVLISSASGTAVYQIEQADGAWKATELWKNRAMKCGYNCPIAYQGFVYGIDGNILACVDVSNGKLAWKSRDGDYGHGQMLLCGDLLVVLAESGELALVEPSPEEFRELGRIQAIDGKTWNNPALVGRRIFVRNHLEMAAYDLPLAE